MSDDSSTENDILAVLWEIFGVLKEIQKTLEEK